MALGNPLTRKLELFGPLPALDKDLLDTIVANPREVDTHRDLISEDDAPSHVQLVIEGLACRYKVLPDGKRSIFAYLLPGDFCDLNIFILKAMDHNIATLAPCRIVSIPRADVLESTERPAIARALWWVTLVDEATLREWLVNLGRRDAESGIAHLFCEIHLRLASVGLVDGGEFQLPITQNELADTAGLSAVHVNRSLQILANRGLLKLNRSQVRIPDIKRLHDLCSFNQNYLHLDGGRESKSGQVDFWVAFWTGYPLMRNRFSNVSGIGG